MTPPREARGWTNPEGKVSPVLNSIARLYPLYRFFNSQTRGRVGVRQRQRRKHLCTTVNDRLFDKSVEIARTYSKYVHWTVADIK